MVHHKTKKLIVRKDGIMVILSVIGVALTLLMFIGMFIDLRRKLGIRLRYKCIFTEKSGYDNIYVSLLEIRNLQDVPVIIEKIYIELDNDVFILIEEFDKLEKINAHDKYKKEYDPVDYYNFPKNEILTWEDIEKSKKRYLYVVVDGNLVKIKGFMKKKRNYIDKKEIFIPIRETIEYRGKIYRSDVKYFVDFKILSKNEKMFTIPIYRNGKSEIKKNEFIPKEIMENSENLREYINKDLKEGVIISEIIDFDLYKNTRIVFNNCF